MHLYVWGIVVSMGYYMMNYNDVIEMVEGFKSFLSGHAPHRYVFFDVQCKANAILLQHLSNDGYWEWAPTRSRKFVSLHQIVAFYCLPHPEVGGSLVEVHHINGNTLDNRPSNLMYVSPDDHTIITKYQRRASGLRLKCFTKLCKGNHLYTPFNRQGRAIKNWAQFMLATIARTIMATTRHCGKWFHVPYPIASIVKSIQHTLKGFQPPTTYAST